MNINIVMMGLLAIALSLHFSHAYFSLGKPPPSQLPWVPIDVNKQRSFVNQTRDAGMFIENSRRLAIIGAHCSGSPFSYKGSTNGSLESYFLTALCPVLAPKDICPPAPNVILSSGDADDDICDVIDAGGAGGMYDIIDLGGASGNVCDV